MYNLINTNTILCIKKGNKNMKKEQEIILIALAPVLTKVKVTLLDDKNKKLRLCHNKWLVLLESAIIIVER